MIISCSGWEHWRGILISRDRIWDKVLTSACAFGHWDQHIKHLECQSGGCWKMELLARGFRTFLRQLQGECHSYSNWLSSGPEGSGARGCTTIVAWSERSGRFVFHWSAVNFLGASAMICMIVSLPALWLVAYQCMAKCNCAKPSPASHLRTSSPSLLSWAVAGQPWGLLSAQHLPQDDDDEGWVVITPAFNHPKINHMVQNGCPVSFFFALMKDAEAPTLPYTCLRMDEGAQDLWRR